MASHPWTFWAKTGDAGKTLSLLDHSADVAACAEALLLHTLLGRRLARLGGLDGDLHSGQIARLCFLAAIHDFGKLGVRFQRQLLPGERRHGHVKPAVRLLDLGNQGSELSDRFYATIPEEELNAWADSEVWTALFTATVCHHGRPYQEICLPSEKDWASAHGIDPMAGLAELVAAARSWFPEAFAADVPPFSTHVEWIHAWNGVLNLADWLGSSRAFFPFETPDPATDRIDFAREQALEVLRWIGLDTDRARTRLGPAAPTFAAVSQYTPRPTQKALGGMPLAAEGSITVLEASTGAGKTEAALWLFARLFHAGRVDGLTFALPTRTAATQIEQRLVAASRRLFGPDGEGPPVVLAVPGYLRVDGVEGHKQPGLPAFEVLWDDHTPAFRRRAWAGEHGKRYLAGGIVVGTVDQVLLSTLQTSHCHLRAACLLRHLLVVDEVHASDTYMTCLLEEVLGHHLQAGGHALLMSATLGTAARQRLLFPGDWRRAKKHPTLAEALDEPYPRISRRIRGQDSIESFSISCNPEGSREKAVAVRLAPLMDDPDRIARRALDAAERGARVLVLRNTVGGCLAVFEACRDLAGTRSLEHLLFGVPFGDGSDTIVAAPHHGRFARSDRRLLDREIEAAFGRDENREAQGRVAVGTQTLEISLDLDADLLITDLCPLDVLLQRIGRLHRHDRPYRPPGFESPRVVVLTPAQRDLRTTILDSGKGQFQHGLGGELYDDLRILEATWRQLETHHELQLPAMNRQLVEHSTHPEALKAIVGDHDDWRRHERHLRGREVGHRKIAKLGLVDWSEPYGHEFDAESKIPTRLGEQDLLVRFEPPLPGPFGKTVAELQVRAHLLGDALDRKNPPEPEDIETFPGGFRFRLAGISFVYDSLGLRNF